MAGVRFRIRTFMIAIASFTLMASTVRFLAFTYELTDFLFIALLYVALVILLSLSTLIELIKRGLGWPRMVARHWGELRSPGLGSRSDPKRRGRESVG
jgi:hypothetical protein